MKSEELDKAILDLLGKDSSPPDNKMHALAERKGIEPDQLEEEVYKLLGDIGKHKDSPDSDFDKGQLAAGARVEKEHTDNPLIARNISKDHLAEMPDYYARLKVMEDSAKKTAMFHSCRDEFDKIATEAQSGKKHKKLKAIAHYFGRHPHIASLLFGPQASAEIGSYHHFISRYKKDASRKAK